MNNADEQYQGLIKNEDHMEEKKNELLNKLKEDIVAETQARQPEEHMDEQPDKRPASHTEEQFSEQPEVQSEPQPEEIEQFKVEIIEEVNQIRQQTKEIIDEVKKEIQEELKEETKGEPEGMDDEEETEISIYDDQYDRYKVIVEDMKFDEKAFEVIDPIKGSHVTYTVKGYDENGPFEGVRRYKDFHKFRKALLLRIPGVFIPPIPPK